MRAVEIETEYSGRLEERRDPDGDFYGTVRFLLGLTAVFLAFVAIFTNVLIGVRVSGDSMNPTLHSGDYLFIYAWGEPDYGDIVVFEHGNEEYIKRVVGLPGDTVWAEDGVLWRAGADGQPHMVEEPYIIEGWTGDIRPTEVPEGCMYVLGDNRVNSTDSRSFGPVDMELLSGVVTGWSLSARSSITRIMDFITFRW